MALCNKIGSVLRHGISQNAPSPMGSMLNYVRCMSSAKLFVGGLSWGTDDQSLRDAFSGFGDVLDARVIVDRNTGKSRGFGFVDFSSKDSATSALTSMDGQDLQGRNIRVTYAVEQAGGGGSFNGVSGGGSYRNGRNGPSDY